MPEQRIVETKLPLTWLITTAGALISVLITLLWNISAQTNKLEQLILSTAKMEKRLDDRDARLDRMLVDFYEMRRIDDAQTLRLNAMESSINNQSKRGDK